MTKSAGTKIISTGMTETAQAFDTHTTRYVNVHTLRKKSASEPVRLGLFDVVLAALFAVVTEGSLASAGFFGLD